MFTIQNNGYPVWTHSKDIYGQNLQTIESFTPRCSWFHKNLRRRHSSGPFHLVLKGTGMENSDCDAHSELDFGMKKAKVLI